MNPEDAQRKACCETMESNMEPDQITRRDSLGNNVDHQSTTRDSFGNPHKGTRRDSFGNPIDHQGTRRDSSGNLLENQGMRRGSFGNPMENLGQRGDILEITEEKRRQNNCALQLIGDIIEGCSGMKVQRTDTASLDKKYTWSPRDLNTQTASAIPCLCKPVDAKGSVACVTFCSSCSSYTKTNVLKQGEQPVTLENQECINSSRDTKHESSSTMFHVLPWQDILFSHIFRCLSLQDIFRLRATNRIGRDCINDYFSVCPTVNLTRCHQKVTPSAFRLVTYTNYKLHTLILRQVKTWLTDDVLIPAFASSSHLTKVDLTSCSSITPRSVVALSGRAPGLQELYLRECAWLTKEAVIMVAQNCPHLEKLDLTGCWAVDDEAVVAVSLCCRKLLYLSIAKIYGITDYSVRCLSTNCTRLQHVNMHGCWRVSDGAIQLLGEYCQQLRILQVKDCRDISELSLGRLRMRGVKIDVQHPVRRNVDPRNLMNKLKLQV